ncbi:MAG TPA: hypothetical protein VM103_00290 [Candidatus Paceibacterota bacterium]|nr:hypothetical protein [Candidatus Paceibacterota bacterium]
MTRLWLAVPLFLAAIAVGTALGDTGPPVNPAPVEMAHIAILPAAALTEVSTGREFSVTPIYLIEYTVVSEGREVSSAGVASDTERFRDRRFLINFVVDSPPQSLAVPIANQAANQFEGMSIMIFFYDDAGGKQADQLGHEQEVTRFLRETST